jgi:uncharacterized protein
MSPIQTHTDAGTVVGRVAALWRYPVKSMAGESLPHVDVSWHGLAGDRRWAFVRDGATRSGFPWLTLREHPALYGYVPRFQDPERPDRSVTLVRTPAGRELDVVSAELADELGHGVRVIKQDRGVFDALPISVITLQTVASLGARVGTILDPRRFRPNLLVDAVVPEPFPEDEWIGRTLRVGGARLRIDKRDQRCVIVTLDPDSTERSPEILRAIAQHRDACLGVYGSTVQPGAIRVGDPVHLEE